MSMDTYGDRRRNKDPFPTPPTPDPRERGVNYAAMMAARDENERDAARVADAYLADRGVRWSPGAAQMAADLLALEALRAPARGVTVTEAMVERAMGVECGSTHHEHHPPDCRRCWQAKLTAALTPDAEGGA